MRDYANDLEKQLEEEKEKNKKYQEEANNVKEKEKNKKYQEGTKNVEEDDNVVIVEDSENEEVSLFFLLGFFLKNIFEPRLSLGFPSPKI